VKIDQLRAAALGKVCNIVLMCLVFMR